MGTSLEPKLIIIRWNIGMIMLGALWSIAFCVVNFIHLVLSMWQMTNVLIILIQGHHSLYSIFIQNPFHQWIQIASTQCTIASSDQFHPWIIFHPFDIVDCWHSFEIMFYQGCQIINYSRKKIQNVTLYYTFYNFFK